MYAFVDLTDFSIIASSVDIPAELAGLDDPALADLSWVGQPLHAVYGRRGYWPHEADFEGFDAATETLAEPVFVVDADRKIIVVSRSARSLTSEELAPLRAQRRDAVMAKRDLVIDGGFTFGGTVFQTGATDRENISGAAQLAFMAMVGSGKQPGDLRWHDGDDDFGWIALDNSVVPMDAPTVIEFAKAVAGFKSFCIRYARYLKDMIDAAENPAAVDIDEGWPA
jgi:hypothetical protein